MDRRISQADTVSRVLKANHAAGHSVDSLAEATSIPSSVLCGIEPFTVTDLVNAGGFLRIHPADLIGAAA